MADEIREQGKSENLENLEEVLGTAKRQTEEDKAPQVTKLDPVPGDEPRPEPKEETGPELAVKQPEPEPELDIDIDDPVPDDLLPENLRLKEPTKKDESPDELDDAEISQWPEKQQEAFKKMRLELKQAREAAKGAGVGKPSPEANKALEELQSKLQEAHNTIARLNLAEDPRFKAKYDSQIGFLVNQIKGQAKALDYDDGIIDAVASMGLRERMNYLSENMPMLKDVALPLFTQIDMLNNNRQTELKNAQANASQMAELQQRQISDLRSKTLQGTIQKAGESGHFLLRKLEGQDKWNQAVDTNIRRAQDILESGDVNLQTEAIVLGALANDYLTLYMKEREARLTATKQLSKYQKAGGRIRNPDGSSGGEKISTPKSLTPEQMLQELEKKKARRQ